MYTRTFVNLLVPRLFLEIRGIRGEGLIQVQIRVPFAYTLIMVSQDLYVCYLKIVLLDELVLDEELIKKEYLQHIENDWDNEDY